MNRQPMNFGFINNHAPQQRTLTFVNNMLAESSAGINININAPMMRRGDAQILGMEDGSNANTQQIKIHTMETETETETDQANNIHAKDIILSDDTIEQVGEEHFPETIEQGDKHHWLFLFYNHKACTTVSADHAANTTTSTNNKIIPRTMHLQEDTSS